MRLVRRIVLVVIITLTVIFVSVQWALPIGLSFYAAKKAPPIVKVVPTDLRDTSVSQSPITNFSYFGYAFEAPWTDLDETKTAFYPKDRPEKNKVDLHFRSGLRLLVTAVPPRELVNGLSTDIGVSPQALESFFGPETMKSDYSFLKAVYEFTPDKMNHWAFSHGPVNRDELLLIIKSIVPTKAADSGIFNLRNSSYGGFQQGNPQVRGDRIMVGLYSDDGGVEMMVYQKDYQSAAGVTQPEINRIVQSFHRAPLGGVSQVAKR